MSEPAHRSTAVSADPLPHAAAEALAQQQWWLGDKAAPEIQRQWGALTAEALRHQVGPHGAWCLSRAPFDSEQLGLKSGRLDMVWATEGRRAQLVKEATGACRASSLAHVVTRTPADDVALTDALGQGGFTLMDESTSYSAASPAPDAIATPGLELGPVREDEVNDLAALAAGSFRDSRLYQDPRIEEHAADRFFQAWARNDLTGRAGTVVVARIADHPVGFTAITERIAPQPLAWIDLVVTAPQAQGQGVAKAMVRAAMGEALKRYSVIGVQTQDDNKAAARLYEGLGFRQRGHHATFHFWCD